MAAGAVGLLAVLVAGQAAVPDRGADDRGAATATLAAGEEQVTAAVERPELFDGRMFVAYYGTVGTPVLGVLGESRPEQAIARVKKAAVPFTRNGLAPQPVFELIVSIADAYPGPDGDFSHDVAAPAVRAWVEAARDAGALLVLDIQTGRSDFVKIAKRWEWALREPHVGLAIDPEWRMKPGQVPGRVIGSVSTWEINLTSRWLQELVEREGLPQKLFVVHQFRRDMVFGKHRIENRPFLAEVQHIDGFGTPGQKLSTYAHVARPRDFRMGFKLFYDEDRPRMSAARVMKIQPQVDFVSFQ